MSCCPEPLHNPVTNERRHKMHHWKERLLCVGFCLGIHVAWHVGEWAWSLL